MRDRIYTTNADFILEFNLLTTNDLESSLSDTGFPSMTGRLL